jgi:aryl-alcohol dehydrogenase
MRVTAAVTRAPGEPYVLEVLELEEPRADEVLVRLVASGHCHTDAVAHQGLVGVPMPSVLGHEGAGVIEAVGAEAAHEVSVGDQVVLSFASCRRCSLCRAGHPAACTRFAPLNVAGQRPDGSTPLRSPDGSPVSACWFGQSSFASYAVAHVSSVVRVDPDLPLERLAPLGCGVQTGAGSVLNVLRPVPGSAIAVFGVGSVGLSAVLAAQASGCDTIVAVDRDERRLRLAEKFGATVLVTGGDGLADRLHDAAPTGVDAALDTTAVSDVIGAAVDLLRSRGVLGLVGIGAPTLETRRLAGSKAVVSITEGDAVPQLFVPKLIALWRGGRFPFDEMITEFPLADINAAETAALAGDVVKPVLRPS